MGIPMSAVKFTANKQTPTWRDRWGGDKLGNWKNGEVNQIPTDVAERMVANYDCFSIAPADKMQRAAPVRKSQPKKKAVTKKKAVRKRR